MTVPDGLAEYTFTHIADSTGELMWFNPPSINAAGTVAFHSQLDDNRAGIFSGSDGSLTAISVSSGPSIAYGSRPTVDDSGVVLFSIFSSSYPYYGASFSPAPAGLPRPSFAAVRRPFPTWKTARSALRAQLFLPGKRGAGPDFVADKVIRSGDELFGSTVTVASMGAEGFNDSGQTGFSYTLADGRSGVAVASPVPEPTAIMFDALSALGLLFPRHRSFSRLTPRSV